MVAESEGAKMLCSSGQGAGGLDMRAVADKPPSAPESVCPRPTMETPGELTSMPGQPASVHRPEPNMRVAGLLGAMVVEQLCPGAKARASTVPPADGRVAIA